MDIPLYMNPAEYLIDLINTDFAADQEVANKKLLQLQHQWSQSQEGQILNQSIASEIDGPLAKEADIGIDTSKGSPSRALLPLTLVHRSIIKSYRDVIVYGIRIAMYMGLAIMMGTVWLRLSTKQDNIQAFINAIFFGGAFMSFMAVAYIPAFLEDRSLFIKERANGLYGAGSFMVANFITGIPFLCRYEHSSGRQSLIKLLQSSLRFSSQSSLIGYAIFDLQHRHSFGGYFGFSSICSRPNLLLFSSRVWYQYSWYHWQPLHLLTAFG